MSLYKIRQGDWGRTLTVQLANADGSPFEGLPTGTTVVFEMVCRTKGTNVSGVAVVAAPDTLTYTFAEPDTQTVGRYEAVFIATYPGGATETFPTCSDSLDGLVVEVGPKLR